MLPLINDRLLNPATLTYPTHDESKPLIDSLPLPPEKAVKLLSAVGVADAFSWCRLPSELSDGQHARFLVASHIASAQQVLIIDNFLNGLDRLTAAAVAWSIQKTIRSYKRTLIVLTPHADLQEHLQPNTAIRTSFGNAPLVTHHDQWLSESPILQAITYHRGTIQDWHSLSHLHYAAGDPATTHSYHVLRHPSLSHPAAVALLSYPDLHSAARNLATENAYKIGGSRTQAMKVNREVLKLSRIITTPELRTIGLTQLLIGSLIPTINARYLECTTAMGRYTGFLQRLGFTEVPQTAHPTEAALSEFMEVNQVPLQVLMDPVAFQGLSDSLSVRKGRELRKVVWNYYHHFVLHRRTRKPVPKVVPAPADPRWTEAYEIAAKRAVDRPAYFILGPLNPEPGAHGYPSKEPAPTQFPDQQLPVHDRISENDP